MHVGVSTYHTNPDEGGIAQYTLSVLRALAHPPTDFSDDRVEFFSTKENGHLLIESGIPSVIAVHDVQHVRQPHFQEHRANGHWERVESFLRNAARSATRVIAESETGKADLLEYYAEHGLTADRVAIVPYTVPPRIRADGRTEEAARVRRELSLPERYVFCPAQFLPYENHVRLVEALGILRMRTGLRVPLVLCGAQNGPLATETWRTLMTTATRMAKAEQILYLGVVKDEDMTGLYSAASVVAMPGYFGPTNASLLEAWALGCPVIASDIRGIREQCGDAALLVPPSSADDIADAILSIWNDDALAAEMSTRGLARATEFPPERFAEALWAALRDAKASV